MSSLNKKNITVNSVKAKSINVDSITGGAATTAYFIASDLNATDFPAGVNTPYTTFTNTANLKGFTFDAGTSSWTCNVSGLYNMGWNSRAVSMVVATTGANTLAIQVNGIDQVASDVFFEVLATSIENRGVSFERGVVLNAGDVVTFRVGNFTAQDFRVTGTQFSCYRISGTP